MIKNLLTTINGVGIVANSISNTPEAVYQMPNNYNSLEFAKEYLSWNATEGQEKLSKHFEKLKSFFYSNRDLKEYKYPETQSKASKKYYIYADIVIEEELYLFFKFIKNEKDEQVQVKNSEITDEKIFINKKDLYIDILNSVVTFPSDLINYEALIKTKDNVLGLLSGELTISQIKERINNLDNGSVNDNETNKLSKFRFRILYNNLNLDKIILESMLIRDLKGKIINFEPYIKTEKIRNNIINELQINGHFLNAYDKLDFMEYLRKKTNDTFASLIFYEQNISYNSYLKIRDKQSPKIVSEINEYILKNQNMKNFEEKRKWIEKNQAENEAENQILKKEIISMLEINEYINFMNSYKNMLWKSKMIGIGLSTASWALSLTYLGMSAFSLGAYLAHAAATAVQASILTYFTVETSKTYDEIEELENELINLKNSKEIKEFRNLLMPYINTNDAQLTFELSKTGLIFTEIMDDMSEKISQKIVNKLSQTVYSKIVVIAKKRILGKTIKIHERFIIQAWKYFAKLYSKKTVLWATAWANPISAVINILDLVHSALDLYFTINFADEYNRIQKKYNDL